MSPETAAVSAINGYLTDPREIDWDISFEQLNEINPNDNMIIPPASADEAEKVEIIRGPNIKPFPKGHKLENEIKPRVALVAGDNITTDHIMPAGAKILPYRSNIPYLSRFCFTVCDPDFPERMKEIQSGIIVAGINYGQGSSREHAALVPLYLGVRCVAAKSFARIHKANLINNGILPLTFVNPDDYNEFSLGDPVVVENVRESVEKGKNIIIKNERTGKRIETQCVLTEREVKSILSGGLINSAGDEQ